MLKPHLAGVIFQVADGMATNVFWGGHYAIEQKPYAQALTCCIQEEKHLQKALHKCKYPAWALNRVKIKQRNSAKKRSNTTRTGHNNPNQQKPCMVMPYYRGLSESLKKICSRSWGASLLQRRQYHQEPPDGPKG